MWTGWAAAKPTRRAEVDLASEEAPDSKQGPAAAFALRERRSSWTLDRLQALTPSWDLCLSFMFRLSKLKISHCIQRLSKLKISHWIQRLSYHTFIKIILGLSWSLKWIFFCSCARLQNWRTIVACRGYMAPEYINRGLITTKSDIFSLGVIIIEIVTGHRDYPDENGVSPQEFIGHVWRLINFNFQDGHFLRACLVWRGLEEIKLPTIQNLSQSPSGED